MKFLNSMLLSGFSNSHISFLIFMFGFASCSNQVSINQTNNSIPGLVQIDSEPTAHYQRLSSLSKVPNIENAALDQFSFPDKVHELTIKVISPAYLSRDEIDAVVNDYRPPANSSEQTRAELDFLLALQESRTAVQKAEALRMHDIVYFPLLGMKKDAHLFFEAIEIYGSGFNAKAYPKTKKLLNNVMKEMRIAEFTAKNFFLRARPRQLDSRLAPLKKMSSSSFASGHTLWAYMQAYVFAALAPEKENEFLNLAFEIGFSREVLGVHYPSDEEAARKMGHALLSKMWDKPEFICDLLAAKAEWSESI